MVYRNVRGTGVVYGDVQEYEYGVRGRADTIHSATPCSHREIVSAQLFLRPNDKRGIRFRAGYTGVRGTVRGMYGSTGNPDILRHLPGRVRLPRWLQYEF